MEKKSKPFQADKYLADGIDIAAYIDEAMLGHVRNDGWCHGSAVDRFAVLK